MRRRWPGRRRPLTDAGITIRTNQVDEGNLVQAGPRSIGRAGLRCGPIAFGCWRFFHEDDAYASRLVEHAVDAGMNLVDTADVYGVDFGGPGFGAAEELLGRVLATSPGLRDRIVLATKGGIRPGVPFDSSASHLRQACEASLRRLQVDHVDLYQVHHCDHFAHPEEVAKSLLALRAEGKTREVGISNYSMADYDALVGYLGPRALATVQPEFSAAETSALDDGTLARCVRDGVTPLAYSPLAGGRIPAGEELRPELIGVLDELSAREGVSRSTLAVAFVLAHPSRPVAIVGSQQSERLDEIAESLNVRLDRRDCYRILEAATGVVLD